MGQLELAHLPARRRVLTQPLLLFAFFFPTVGALCFAVWFRDGLCAKCFYWATKGGMILLPLACLGAGGILRLFRTAASHRQSGGGSRAAFEGFVSGGIILGFAYALTYSPIVNSLAAAATRVHDSANQLEFVQVFPWVAAYVIFVHSILEEVYWRGMIFTELSHRCRTVAGAHTLTAIGFAANHLVLTLCFFSVEVALLFTAFCAIGGWLWSFMAMRHGSLIGAVISHMLVDALLMGVAYCWVTGGAG